MRNKALAVPYVVWMAIFVIAPLVLIVAYAFTAKSGGVTLDNFSNMGQYLPAFQHSFVLAGAATLICILIGYPLAYFLSKESLMVRKVAMMLIMLPMWMNFLLRTYSWMSILENNGLLNQLRLIAGVDDRQLTAVRVHEKITVGANGSHLHYFDLHAIPPTWLKKAFVAGQVQRFSLKSLLKYPNHGVQILPVVTPLHQCRTGFPAPADADDIVVFIRPL